MAPPQREATMAATARSVIRSFEEMVRESGMVAAMNAYFGAYGTLPAEKTPGEYYEAVGDRDLGEDVETYIKSNFSH